MLNVQKCFRFFMGAATLAAMLASSATAMSATALRAGGESSGGGLVIGDRGNPWFLENTENVRYCIITDTAHFSASVDESRAAITRALNYWQSALTSRPKIQTQIRVGTQNFTEVPCDHEAIDLHFVLGQLTAEQKKLLGNLKSTIGTTYRTSYDPINMKASGFVYVAPDSGPGTPDVSLKQDFWGSDDNFRLDLVLMHELGHVFGLQHRATFLMNERFVETLAYDSENGEAWKYLRDLWQGQGYLEDANGKAHLAKLCSHVVIEAEEYKRAAQLLAAPASGCLEVNVDDYFQVKALYTAPSATQPVEWGKTISNHPNLWETGFEILITIYLPIDQVAVPRPPEDDLWNNYWFGYPIMQESHTVALDYKLNSGATSKLLMSGSGQHSRIFGGIVAGNLEWEYLFWPFKF